MSALAAELPLVAAASGGRTPHRPMDEARFEAFYRKSASGLWSYLHRMTGDAALADDLLQKAFIRFLRANPAFAGEEHMRRYAYRAATSVAMDHFRETKRRREVPEVDTTVSQAETDLRHDMSRVFAELKPRERALLWLAHVEESGHEEIAEALGLRPRSIRVLLFRARRKLAAILAKRGIGPEVLR
ncbi:MAG TPA: sigma-70 family RNA polymerase sigma factor [Thermoanaerobaculia bacterium]|nr:sigma-70 family RNA polymerase sigma factor [Thermoanaerobaculia bacterium]